MNELDYKQMIAYIFHDIYSQIDMLYEKAEKQGDSFKSDTMKALFRGEIIGYERTKQQIDYIKDYVESNMKNSEKDGE